MNLEVIPSSDRASLLRLVDPELLAQPQIRWLVENAPFAWATWKGAANRLDLVWPVRGDQPFQLLPGMIEQAICAYEGGFGLLVLAPTQGLIDQAAMEIGRMLDPEEGRA